MAIAFDQSDSNSSGTAVASSDITPAGGAPADGKLLVITVGTEGNNTSGDHTFPTGFVQDIYINNGAEAVIASKIASSEGTTFTTSVATNSEFAPYTLFQADLNGGSGALHEAQSGSGSSASPSSCTTSSISAADRDDCIMFYIYAQDDNSIWNEDPASIGGTATTGGLVEEESFTSGSSADVCGEAGYALITGKGTITVTSASDAQGGETTVIAAAVYEGSADAGGGDPEPSLIGGKLVNHGLIQRHLVHSFRKPAPWTPAKRIWTPQPAMVRAA